MLLKSKQKKRIKFPKKTSFLILGIGILVASFFLFKNLFQSNQKSASIFCDAENVSNNYFIGNNEIKLRNGNTQSDEKAYSGNYSAKLSTENPFGFTYELNSISKGDLIEISVWVYGGFENANLVIQGENDYYQNFSPLQNNHNKWVNISEKIFVDENIAKENIKIYTWFSGSNGFAYFDDFKIVHTKSGAKDFYQNIQLDSIRILNLQTSDKGFYKLNQKRNNALKKGVIVAQDNDWVKVRLEENKQNFYGKMRLKGDWLDHLQGKKWSFRVSLNSDNAWNRLMTFSLQNPKTRALLKEWVFHQMLEINDVLTTRYDFLKLSLNKESLGIYAYEEHFEKQLLEFRNRREGPILKFSEDAMWKLRVAEINQGISLGAASGSDQLYQTNINVFKENKTIANPVLKNHLEQANLLMDQYRKGEIPFSQIFDMDLVAKYFAILDVQKAYHGLIWHNHRWYFNPISQKLEPIGFDGFIEEGTYDWIGKPFLGYGQAPKKYTPLLNTFFSDFEFCKLYISYLDSFSSSNYVSIFQNKLKNKLTYRTRIIQAEFSDYEYDDQYLEKNAKKIQLLLYPVEGIGLKVYKGPNDAYFVSNRHHLPIEVLGFGNSINEMETNLEKPILLKAFHKLRKTKTKRINLKKRPKFFFYKVMGLDSLLYSPIKPYHFETKIPAKQDLFQQINLTENSIYSIQEKQIIFKSGEHTINKPIIIPNGYEVLFPAGLKLDLTNGAFFLSQSEILMMGTKDNPIYIGSSDSSARGFTIINSKNQNFLNYTIFNGFSTLSYKGWQLTGAINFYESEIKMNHVSIVNNHCEDALNLIRSKFEINDLKIKNTFADGFDADFCQGKLTNCFLENTGNDGLDFSGSQITISDCKINQPGDKGISVGEESTIKIVNVSINQAVIALASKDLSKVNVQNISINNCKLGIVAYQKKPEYGPAKIIVKGLEIENVKNNYQIEKGSELIVDGKKIKSD